MMKVLQNILRGLFLGGYVSAIPIFDNFQLSLTNWSWPIYHEAAPKTSDSVNSISLNSVPSVHFGNSDEKLSTNVNIKYFNRLNRDLGLSWDQGGQTISFNGSQLDIQDANTFIPDIKTILISHGYSGSSSNPQSCEDWVKNYLKSGQDVQIICVDWTHLAKLSPWQQITSQYGEFYTGEAKNSVDVGWWLGRLLQILVNNTGLNVDKIHLIGHSLGAHVVGVMGRTFSSLSGSDQQVARVTGLDPAGPLFVEDKYGLKKHMIGRDSGAFVDIIHGNGNFNPYFFNIWNQDRYYGDLHALGHADFYANGGMTQLATGCSVTGVLKKNCSHSRPVEYYMSSILDGPTAFPAYPCASAKTCSEEKTSSETVANHMGEYAKKPRGVKNKQYYLAITTNMGPTNNFGQSKE